MSNAPSVSLNPERPKCKTKVPDYLSEYHFLLLQSSNSKSLPSPHHTTLYPLSSVLSYKKFSPSYYMCLLAHSLETEPKTFKEAMASDVWKATVNDELQEMEANRTWDVVSLPKDKIVVGCRWIHTIKYKADCTIERPKSRLVAKGYTQ